MSAPRLSLRKRLWWAWQLRMWPWRVDPGFALISTDLPDETVLQRLREFDDRP